MGAYTWTTGPVNRSGGTEELHVTFMNDSDAAQRVEFSLYDLSYTPKRAAAGDTLRLQPHSSAFVTIPLRQICSWELRYKAFSRRVRCGISTAGPGPRSTVILSRDFILLSPGSSPYGCRK